MDNSQIPRRCTPEEVLVLVDTLRDYLFAFHQGNADGLAGSGDAGFDDFVRSLPTHVAEMAGHLKREAILRNISGDAVLRFQANWGRLFREHPDPIQGLKRFREYLADDVLIGVETVLDALKIKAQEDIARPPPDQMVLRPAAYYRTLDIMPNTLLAAKRAGKLPGARLVGNRWHYVESEVRRLYPEKFDRRKR